MNERHGETVEDRRKRLEKRVILIGGGAILLLFAILLGAGGSESPLVFIAGVAGGLMLIVGTLRWVLKTEHRGPR